MRFVKASAGNNSILTAYSVKICNSGKKDRIHCIAGTIRSDMSNKEKIMESIIEAIDELNEQLPEESRLQKSIDTPLFGQGSMLDSLGLVSLVTTLEQKIEKNLGKNTTLLEDIVGLDDDNPFRTINALADYVTLVLEKKAV